MLFFSPLIMVFVVLSPKRPARGTATARKCQEVSHFCRWGRRRAPRICENPTDRSVNSILQLKNGWRAGARHHPTNRPDGRAPHRPKGESSYVGSSSQECPCRGPRQRPRRRHGRGRQGRPHCSRRTEPPGRSFRSRGPHGLVVMPGLIDPHLHLAACSALPTARAWRLPPA